MLVLYLYLQYFYADLQLTVSVYLSFQVMKQLEEGPLLRWKSKGEQEEEGKGGEVDVI